MAEDDARLDETAALDEDAAWALVRAAVPRAVLEPGPRRVASLSRPDLWLELSESGAWEASAPPTPAARDLLDLYLPLTRGSDFVIGQLGQSLDGRIATVSGKSHYITGPEDIRRLHRLRALVDAVIVGASTVALDDPGLTVREVEGENPVRVVLDPDGRLGQDRRVFSDRAARTLVVRRTAAPAGPVRTPGDGAGSPHTSRLRPRGLRAGGRAGSAPCRRAFGGCWWRRRGHGVEVPRGRPPRPTPPDRRAYVDGLGPSGDHPSAD